MMELWASARSATNVGDLQGTGVHPLCRALEGGPQTDSFPAWYSCHGGGDNDMVVCSSSDRVYEHRTSLFDENWSSAFSTTNLRFMTDSTSSTWWVFEGRREIPPDERTGFTGPAWIDCDGYYAHGGEVDGEGDRNMQRALEGEERPR
ncbi:unnamed protein product [Ectocarpus sp. CCAP 1310/34]|nr:unnamed protein product [Ectocarpus sp. CCAP 1310/34]